MLSAFQPSAFQNTGFQIDGSGVTPPTPTVVTGPTPAGKPGRDSRRKRYVLPDGQWVFATEGEVAELLGKFLVREEKQAFKQGRRKRTKVVRTPVAVEAPEFQMRLDGLDEMWVPVLPEGAVWKPNPRDLALALLIIKRRKDDEEALLALML